MDKLIRDAFEFETECKQNGADAKVVLMKVIAGRLLRIAKALERPANTNFAVEKEPVG